MPSSGGERDIENFITRGTRSGVWVGETEREREREGAEILGGGGEERCRDSAASFPIVLSMPPPDRYESQSQAGALLIARAEY